MTMRALLIEFDASNEAIAQRLHAEGVRVAVVHHTTLTAERLAVAAALDIEVFPAGSELPRNVDMVIPSSSVPWNHPLILAAERNAVLVEGELGFAAARTQKPIVAITGTRGKTTVATLTAAMLSASQCSALAVGGSGSTALPLVEAIEAGAEVLVTEVSSSQLYYAAEFHPTVGTWLNFDEDQLDWHPTADHYRDAKARLWKHMDRNDVAVVNADDAVVRESVMGCGAERQAFSLKTPLDWWFDRSAGALRGPDGDIFIEIADMPKALPGDLANALAATATAMAAGANLDACAETLFAFNGLQDGGVS